MVIPIHDDDDGDDDDREAPISRLSLGKCGRNGATY